MAETIVTPERNEAAAGAFMQKSFGDLVGMISTALVVIGDRLDLF